MIRVLVADDSPTLRRFVTRVLEATGRVEVCGTVDDGRTAVRAVGMHQPDVVVMDIRMPHQDGLAATIEIVAAAPRPIVLFCGTGDAEAQARAFAALAAGAVALVPKPGPGVPLEAVERELVAAVEAAAARSVRARAATPARAGHGEAPAARARLVAIGASTGGPAALRDLLRALPADPGAPVLIVQHNAPAFAASFVRWLAGEVPQRVAMAEGGERPAGDRVLVAPPGAHLVLRGGRLALREGEPVQGHRPSVDALFESVADDVGPAAVGVLLSGMGEDGARGLLALRRRGATTLVQDEASSVVFGMAGVAERLGAVGRAGRPEALARWVAEAIGRERPG